MQHLLCRHAHQLVAVDGQLQVAGVLPVHPVGNAAADAIDLDALPDHVAVAGHAVVVLRALLRFDQLHLQRHWQTILRPPVPDAGEHLASLLPFAPSQRLQTFPHQHAIGISELAPAGPQLGELLLVVLRTPDGLGLDASGDAIGHALVERTDHPRVIPSQMPGARQQRRKAQQ